MFRVSESAVADTDVWVNGMGNVTCGPTRHERFGFDRKTLLLIGLYCRRVVTGDIMHARAYPTSSIFSILRR